METTIKEAQDITDEIDESSDSEGNILDQAISKIKGGISGLLEKGEELLNRFIEAIAVMMVTSCLIPIVVLLFAFWIIRMLFGIQINAPKDLPKRISSKMPGGKKKIRGITEKRRKCMKSRGKSINLFLMDGEATGRIKCTLANWTGVAYKIPRTELEKCKDREDLKQSGVYFLFGISDDSGKEIVYIGQAGSRKNGEGILNRLQEHKRNPEKDYWTEAIVITTSNNSFGPTEISYLENRFCNLALAANRYEVKNGNDPTHGNITEEKECEMEEFIDNAKVVMGTLGHKLFEPLRKPASEQGGEISGKADSDGRLHLERNIKNVGKVEANGMQTSEGFVVLQGSHISPSDDDTIPAVIKERRRKARVDESFVCRKMFFLTVRLTQRCLLSEKVQMD